MDVYTKCCTNKAKGIIKDPNQPDNCLFFLLRLGRGYQLDQTSTERLRMWFYPQATRKIRPQTPHDSTDRDDISLRLYLHDCMWQMNKLIFKSTCSHEIYQLTICVCERTSDCVDTRWTESRPLSALVSVSRVRLGLYWVVRRFKNTHTEGFSVNIHYIVVNHHANIWPFSWHTGFIYLSR